MKKDYKEYTDSKTIAEIAGVKHHAVQQLIKKYKEDFEEFGELKYVLSKCATPIGGRPQKAYTLNKQQTILLIFLLNGCYELKRHVIKNLYKDNFLENFKGNSCGTGYIYIAEWKNGLVKIGKAKNPEKRLATLRTQSPIEIKQIYISGELPNYHEIEIEVHHYFSEYRKHGEYFDLPFGKAVEYIEKLTKKAAI